MRPAIQLQQYSDLLGEILRWLPESHVDFHDLTAAHDLIMAQSISLRDAMQWHRRQAELRFIEASIVGVRLVHPDRYLVASDSFRGLLFRKNAAYSGNMKRSPGPMPNPKPTSPNLERMRLRVSEGLPDSQRKSPLKSATETTMHVFLFNDLVVVTKVNI